MRTNLRNVFLAGLFCVMAVASPLTAQSKRKVIIDQDARAPRPRTSNRSLSSCNRQKSRRSASPSSAAICGVTKKSRTRYACWKSSAAQTFPSSPVPSSRLSTAKNHHSLGGDLRQGLIQRRLESKAYRDGIRGVYHGPYEVPKLVEGNPTTKPSEEDAAHFIIRMVHKHPHEVTIYAGGPLTNIAQAISIDPQVPDLARNSSSWAAASRPSFRMTGLPKIAANSISGGTPKPFILSTPRPGTRLRTPRSTSR